MAIHSELPIYKVTFELLVLATELVRRMPRDARVSVGTKLASECLELVVLIYRANCAREKAPHLDELLERLQVAELLLRLSRDLRIIATKHYAAAIELTQSIGRQANGWRKYRPESPVA